MVLGTELGGGPLEMRQSLSLESLWSSRETKPTGDIATDQEVVVASVHQC